MICKHFIASVRTRELTKTLLRLRLSLTFKVILEFRNLWWYWTPVDIKVDKSTLQSSNFHRFRFFKFAIFDKKICF